MQTCITLAMLCLGIAAGCAVAVAVLKAKERVERRGRASAAVDERALTALRAWMLVNWAAIAADEAARGYPLFGYRGFRKPHYCYNENAVPTLRVPMRCLITKDGVVKGGY